ncbi:MAG: ATP-binding cassette domain-containing protein, partial [Chloroflexota bacterium]|nr:ATP-binding cassette domain-containing protein [Chloroflexota bacterium]
MRIGRSRTDAATPASAEDTAVIRAEGVVKTYDTGTAKLTVLKGLDVAVQRGEMVAVMGPSGCGKTTLLNCLSGLDTVDEGRVLIEGQDLAKLSDRKRT